MLSLYRQNLKKKLIRVKSGKISDYPDSTMQDRPEIPAFAFCYRRLINCDFYWNYVNLISMKDTHRFTVHIVIGMVLGILFGLAVKFLPLPGAAHKFLVDGFLHVGSEMFIRLIQLLVIPIVLVSLICGASSMGDFKQLGRIGGKSFLLYILTTAIAVALALLFAELFRVGSGLKMALPSDYVMKSPPGVADVLINLIPSNPFQALSSANMLQIIVFALLLGIAITAVGEKGERFHRVIVSANEVLLKLILIIMKTVPLGVFLLLGKLFARIGFSAIGHLLSYFICVLVVLAIQFFACYPSIIFFIARLNPLIFIRKMYSAMMFAFSISSSTASIPIVLETVERRLGVHNSVASFVIPLGATINMDGTAIMQGVATVFIANAYHISIGITGYLTVIMMATLASIGTAGVPGVGMLTLALVLRQVGLPVQGIMLIIGIDRLLDMVRTAVNISGDSMVATVVAKTEKKFSLETYRNKAL